MSDNDSGFKVKDRRSFNQEGELRPDQEETQAAPAEPAAGPREESQAGPAPGGKTGPAGEQAPRGLPPVDFGGFILSLSHAALMHMGQAPDPQTGQAAINLELARHTIDTLAMLQDKTKGNLDEEEQRLVDNALSQLRMIFVQVVNTATKGRGA